jgi:hypothetical protein
MPGKNVVETVEEGLKEGHGQVLSTERNEHS